MNSKPVNTESNVIANGHFDEGYAHWEDVGAPGGNIDLKSGEWDGVSIAYMSLYKGSGVGQVMPAPVQQSAGERYSLSFLYDNRHEQAGSFLISRQGTDDKLEIPLPPSGNSAQDPGTRALSLTLVTTPLEFDVVEDDVFNIEIKSPSQATALKDVIVARINLHVELPPLVLAHITNDGQVFTPGDQPCLYLCHGATGEASHQLSFEPAPGSPWAGTEALLWSLDNPLEAVVVSPGWGENQLIETPWRVDCPEPVRDDTQLFSLSIYSKYHADTYPIAVSLGHHRLIVDTCLEPAYQPVIEYGQSVKLGVQVKSYYLDLPMRDYEVCWMLDEQVLFRANTDEGGFAWFDYTPATEGLRSIDASVQSPFYAQGSAVQTFSIRAHATDPLKAVKVQFPSMQAAFWGERQGYPDRGAKYQLSALFATDSPLRDLNVWLMWEGGSPDELGVTVQPPLLEPVLVTGTQLDWELDCQDIKDSTFGLRLRCAELREPTVINPMSLARHSLKIGEVREANRTPVVDEGDYVWCMLRVLSLGDQPISGVPIEWDTPQGLQRTYTGKNGWASVIDRPAVHGDYTITARVNPREEGQLLEHAFAIKTVQTSSWKTASFTLGGVAVDRVNAGVVCDVGQFTTQLHLKVEPGSPLIGKNVSLQWRDPESANVILIRKMADKNPITPEGVLWNVYGTLPEVSGVFDLLVLSTGLEPLDLAFRTLPLDFAKETTLVFDQQPENWDAEVDLYPCIGTSHDLTILPTNDLGGLHGLMLETSLAPDLPPGWILTPSLTEPSPMTAGGVRYRCDFTGATEPAERSWNVKVLAGEEYTQPPALRLKLAHNKVVIGTAFEVATDPVLSKAESARLAVRYLSAFTGKPASNVPVEWDDVEEVSVTGPDGIAQRDYQPLTTGGQNIRALISNPYDATQIEHTFEVHAYQDDPWLDLNVQAGLNVTRSWGGQTLFPRRGDKLDLILSAPQDSPLHNQALTLGLIGVDQIDPQLSFGPVGLGVPREWATDGLPVSLLAGDQTDAAFSLQLSASRLLARSPLNAFSLGSNAQALIMSGRSQEHEVADWHETMTFEITLASALSGRSAKNIQVEWEGTDVAMEHAITSTNFYGVTRISFIATIPGPGRLTARIVGGTDVFEFEYHVQRPCVIQDLTSPGLENYPGEEVSAEATVVSASTGEPVEGVKVHWYFKGVVLEPVVTDAQGKARIVFLMPPRIGNFVLSASVQGDFGKESARLVFTILASVDTWVGEFTLWLNGEEVDLVDEQLRLLEGIDNTLELRVRKDSSLINSTSAALDMLEAGELGLEFAPPLGTLLPVTSAPLFWSISTSEGSVGPFLLQLTSPQLPSRPVLGTVVYFVQDAYFDEFPIAFQEDAAYPCHGATHTVSVRPKPSNPLLGKHLQLEWAGQSAENLGVVVTPPLENAQLLTLEGVTWELNCLQSIKDGEFNLRLEVVESGEASSRLFMSLEHNSVTAEHWSTGPHYARPDLPYYRRYIRATSAFLKTPAGGVTVSYGPYPSHGLTNPSGEYSVNDYLELGGFKIFNRYDGSIV